MKNKQAFTLAEVIITLGIKRNTEGDSPKYLIDNKDKKNVILSKIEGSHNKEILHSLHSLRMIWGKGVNVFSILFSSHLNVCQKYNVILNFTKRTNELASCVSLYAQVRSSQKIQDLSSYRFRLGGRNDSDRKELINLSTYPLINFQKAFTLAEVLITLGIIGVVAAMTIPALMTHFQQEQTVTKLKKALSVINQAYKLSYDEVGEPENAFYIGSEEYFKNYWAPYIKVLTYCNNYKMCGYNSNGPFKLIDGRQDGTALVMGNARTTFLTMDGLLYIIATAGNNAGTLVPVYWVLVDINGGKGPKRWGKDVFWLDRISDGQGVQPQCYKKSNRDVNNGCKTGQGACCAEKIRRAGWKIEKDYPWK